MIHIFYRKDILTLHVPYDVHYIIVTSSSDVSEYEIEQTFYLLYLQPFYYYDPLSSSLSLSLSLSRSLSIYLYIYLSVFWYERTIFEYVFYRITPRYFPSKNHSRAVKTYHTNQYFIYFDKCTLQLFNL